MNYSTITMLRPIKLTLNLLCVIFLLLVAGCGDDSDSPRQDEGTGEDPENSDETMEGTGGTDAGTGGNASTCDPDKNDCNEGFACGKEGDDTFDCFDIDECDEGLDDCDAHSYCVNSDGSYSCEPCPAGYQLDDADECLDVDECAGETHSCNKNATCQNTEGSYQCSCQEGYSGNGEDCRDVDECAEGLAQCDEDLECINAEGSYFCEACPEGHELKAGECADIDECTKESDLCHEHASCENTEGSYDCLCEEGFVGDGDECLDIDECTENLAQCDEGLQCINTDGAYLCAPCPEGYELEGKECTDVDECAEDKDSCNEHASCENSIGSYTCTCLEGFSGDGLDCLDVDECTKDLAVCDEELSCVNNEGSYSCEPCPTGYELDGVSCVDIDECAVENGGCGDGSAGICENSDGGFACICADDYLLVDGGCVYTVPHVLTSTPEQGAIGAYPAEYYWDPAPGRGVRDRFFVHLTFDLEMDKQEATVIVTDDEELEIPRAVEGTWDESGHILTVVIVPHDDAALYPLFDSTTYNISFAELKSQLGGSADPEDPSYPEARLTFTTGQRDPLLNHSCLHTQHGPFEEVTASTSSTALFPATDTAHTHYTINLPAGAEGEPNVGYTFFFPNNTGTHVLFLRDASDLELETTGFFAGLTPWNPEQIDEAAAACHTVDSVVTDQETGGDTIGPPVTGITHQTTLDLSDQELYVFRWSSLSESVQVIVEYVP